MRLPPHRGVQRPFIRSDRWRSLGTVPCRPRLPPGAGQHVDVPPWVRALDIPELADRPVAAFGPEGDWLLVSRPEGVSLLAGEPSFIARVVERAGGWDVVRGRFDAWAAGSSVPAEALAEIRQRASLALLARNQHRGRAPDIGKG